MRDGTPRSGGAEDSFRSGMMTCFPAGASLEGGETILTPNAKELLYV